ncbi:uncharacterized protein A4U43_C04F20120 [Asparagus officinalis]|uniref:BSD domain-containing protein n=1 Tax=Asparagus officinalis TaxID=4686 RepID=A0A5P1F2D3_ASPOF|nr:uncharacterized protein LOC109837634 [Asparagus officinalis]XP_020261546.1 uncharacterized protein LOC109837634 [Asparagus officinalis]ONK72505.1 uncharacterized protein A4U43_C04F20120 [Asparagus officinalis]
MGSFFKPWAFTKGKASEGAASENQKAKREEGDEAYLEEFGVTEQLLDYVKGFTINAFKDYPLQDDEKGQQIDGCASNVSKDLTEWQERHATLVLSKAKEIAQLRYVLCPRHLKERQFWRIYFLLVKTYTSPYEIRALTKAKLRMLEIQNEKSIDKAAIEVEMTDTKLGSDSSITLQCNSEQLADEL